MKKILIAVISIMMVISLSACKTEPKVDMPKIIAEYTEKIEGIDLSGFTGDFLKDAKKLIKKYSEKISVSETEEAVETLYKELEKGLFGIETAQKEAEEAEKEAETKRIALEEAIKKHEEALNEIDLSKYEGKDLENMEKLLKNSYKDNLKALEIFSVGYIENFTASFKERASLIKTKEEREAMAAKEEASREQTTTTASTSQSSSGSSTSGSQSSGTSQSSSSSGSQGSGSSSSSGSSGSSGSSSGSSSGGNSSGSSGSSGSSSSSGGSGSSGSSGGSSGSSSSSGSSGSSSGSSGGSGSQAHEHNWEKRTDTEDVWVVDKPAWDETVLVKDAWDEVVTETTYEKEWAILTCTGLTFTGPTAQEDVYEWQRSIPVEDLLAGACTNYTTTRIEIPVTTEKVVHHDAEYETVHHEAEGHYETVKTEYYVCTGCGATK